MEKRELKRYGNPIQGAGLISLSSLKILAEERRQKVEEERDRLKHQNQIIKILRADAEIEAQNKTQTFRRPQDLSALLEKDEDEPHESFLREKLRNFSKSTLEEE